MACTVSGTVCNFVFQPSGSSTANWFFFGFCLLVCLFVCYRNCSVVQLEVSDGDSPRSFFIVENSFHYPGFFVIPKELANGSF